MSLHSSHSPQLAELISLTSSRSTHLIHLCSYIYFFIFRCPSLLFFPFSVLNLCLIKLLPCGVIRSYNFFTIESYACQSKWMSILATFFSHVLWIPAFCVWASKIVISNSSPWQGRRVNRLLSFTVPLSIGQVWCKWRRSCNTVRSVLANDVDSFWRCFPVEPEKVEH